MTQLSIERAIPDLEPTGDGWTLYGRAVPYGIESRVVDPGAPPYWEEFAQSTFARDVGNGCRWVNLYAGHAGDFGDRFLARCRHAVERDDGLHLEFRIDRERANPELAEAARSGELTGWSIKATVYRSRELVRGARRVVLREKAAIEHVAATKVPQYAGAGVLVARDHELIAPEPTPVRDLWAAKYGTLARP